MAVDYWICPSGESLLLRPSERIFTLLGLVENVLPVPRSTRYVFVLVSNYICAPTTFYWRSLFGLAWDMEHAGGARSLCHAQRQWPYVVSSPHPNCHFSAATISSNCSTSRFQESIGALASLFLLIPYRSATTTNTIPNRSREPYHMSIPGTQHTRLRQASFRFAYALFRPP